MDSLIDPANHKSHVSYSPSSPHSPQGPPSALSASHDDDDETDTGADTSRLLSSLSTSDTGLRERGSYSQSRATKFRSLISKADLFPKAEEEVTVHTNSGVIVTIITLIVISMLTFSELMTYLTPITTEHMVVDTTASERLGINIDIEFHSLPCEFCKFDLMAVTGENQEAIESSLTRTPIPAPPSHRRPDAASGSSNPTVARLSTGEGCRVQGSVYVKKVAGNLHVAVGAVEVNSAHHRHKFAIGELKAFNASHTIHKLTFGQTFPGQPQPLNGVSAIASGGPTQYQYFLKVVPTTFTSHTTSKSFGTNQFSVTERATLLDPSAGGSGGSAGIPSVFFIYDFSPFRVVVEERRVPLTEFVVSLCAIVGGVLTVVGIGHSVYYHGKRMVVAHRVAREIEMNAASGNGGMHGLLRGEQSG